MLCNDHNNTNSSAQAVADGILMALNFREWNNRQIDLIVGGALTAVRATPTVRFSRTRNQRVWDPLSWRRDEFSALAHLDP